MIARLRRRHASLIGSVTIVVPVLVVLALALRPEAPIMVTAGTVPATDEWTPLDPGESLHALLESEGNREWLHLVREGAFVAPDVLVYWSSERIAADEPFPVSAVLLGALEGVGAQTLNLPARDVSGVLTLYSLGHQAIVATTPVSSIRRLDRDR